MKNKLSVIPLALLFVAASVIMACSQTPKVKQPSSADSESESNRSINAKNSSELPKPDGFVNDYADVLDDDAEKEIEDVLKQLQKRAKIDFAVAILKSTNGQKIFDYSLAIAKEWKVGSENGGILLVVATEDRSWHIQIDKRLEKDLTNDDVKQIGDVMIPDFKQANHPDGLKKCVEKMIAVLAAKQKFEPIKF